MLEGDWNAHNIFSDCDYDMFDKDILMEEREAKFLHLISDINDKILDKYEQKL